MASLAALNESSDHQLGATALSQQNERPPLYMIVAYANAHAGMVFVDISYHDVSTRHMCYTRRSTRSISLPLWVRCARHLVGSTTDHRLESENRTGDVIDEAQSSNRKHIKEGFRECVPCSHVMCFRDESWASLECLGVGAYSHVAYIHTQFMAVKRFSTILQSEFSLCSFELD